MPIAKPLKGFTIDEVMKVLMQDDVVTFSGLIDKGLDVNAMLIYRPIFMEAFFSNAIDIFSLMLEYRQDLKLNILITDKKGWNVLHLLLFNSSEADESEFDSLVKSFQKLLTPHLTKYLCTMKTMDGDTPLDKLMNKIGYGIILDYDFAAKLLSYYPQHEIKRFYKSIYRDESTPSNIIELVGEMI